MSPTAWTVAVLLVVAALGLAAAAVFALRNRGRTDVRLTGQTVVARAISYAALAAALALAVLVGPWGIAVLILILGSVALLEWARMTGLPVYHKVALVIANVIVVAAVSLLGTSSAPWLIAGIVLTGLAWPVIRVDTDRAVRDLGFAAVGFLSIAVLLVHGVALGFEGGEAGVVLVAALAGACAGSDIGAFLVGRRFGRTPLAARLSPAKTRAGLVGNFVRRRGWVAGVRAGSCGRLRRVGIWPGRSLRPACVARLRSRAGGRHSRGIRMGRPVQIGRQTRNPA